MTEISVPAITDDDGTGQTGTACDKTWADAFEAGVNAVVHSSANPTITPEDVIDEVVTARGGLASLDTRLDVALNNDGTLKESATLVTVAQAQALMGAKNLLTNDTFMIWAGGDGAKPTGWGGAGNATIARCGASATITEATVPPDTKRKVGPFCVSSAWVAAAHYLKQSILDTGVWAHADHLEGKTIGFGAWIWCNQASYARCYVGDGAGSTYSTLRDNVAGDGYHSGGSGWEWISGTHTISNSATSLFFATEGANLAGTYYVSGTTAIVSPFAPYTHIPCETVYGQISWSFVGNPAIADGARRFLAARPMLITDVQGVCGTAPGGGNKFEINIERNHGAGWNSIFTTDKTLIDGAAAVGGVQPDDEYEYRCLTGIYDTTFTDGYIRLNLTTVDNTADVTILVRAMQYCAPYEYLKDYDDIV